MSWGRQHTPIPEQSTEGSPRPASSPEPPALIPSPRLRSPGHPWSKWENVMYLTTTPETERVSWKGDMEDPQEWMKQFFPSGTNKIQHDNEENTFGFYPFTMQLSSQICSSTSPCQLLSLGQLFRFDFFFFNCIVFLNFSGALHYNGLHRASLWQFTFKGLGNHRKYSNAVYVDLECILQWD